MNRKNQKAYRVSVTGRVQGVGFRYYTKKQAELLQIRGWVRNEISGSVTVFCQGSEHGLEAFFEKIRRGPALAQVTDVKAETSEPDPELTGFRIR